MKARASLIIMMLAFVSAVTTFSTDAQAVVADEMPGLIGIQYGSEDFTDAEDLVTLSSLEQNWDEDSGFGREWSGKWEGWIIGPSDGEVKFTMSADQDAKVEIAGKLLLSSQGTTAAGMTMIKGQKYPIVVTYVKEGSEYECSLKVQWSWADKAAATIDSKNLLYSAAKEAELDVIVQASDDDDNDDEEADDDDSAAGPKVEFEYQPTGLQITIGGKPFASYYTGSTKIPRPYFANVMTPSGVQVTRNHPPVEGKDSMDHDTYHPGIWLTFAGINGNDYWRLKKKTEHEMFIGSPEGGAGKGTFTVSNFYLDAKDSTGNRIAHEICKYTILVRPSYYLLIYDSTISSDKSDIVFGDDQEYGLGVRIQTPVEERYGGQILNADGLKGAKEAYGKASNWCDYSGVLNDTLIGMTVMPDPANFRPCWYHTRDYGLIAANPFGRKGVAGGEKSEVLVKKDEKFHLGFGIAIYSAAPGSEVNRDAMYKDYLSVIAAQK
jgi:hypothetical protein